MNNFKMHSNFIKNKEKKENEDSVRNKKINLRPIDHIFNIRDEDSITYKSKLKSWKEKFNYLWNIFGVDFKNFQFRLTYFGEE